MDKPTCETCPYFSNPSSVRHLATCRRFPADKPGSTPTWEDSLPDGYWCGEHPDFPAWIESQRKPS